MYHSVEPYQVQAMRTFQIGSSSSFRVTPLWNLTQALTSFRLRMLIYVNLTRLVRTFVLLVHLKLACVMCRYFGTDYKLY